MSGFVNAQVPFYENEKKKPIKSRGFKTCPDCHGSGLRDPHMLGINLPGGQKIGGSLKPKKGSNGILSCTKCKGSGKVPLIDGPWMDK